jgi:ABC-type uncharacterized transport system permease subunit
MFLVATARDQQPLTKGGTWAILAGIAAHVAALVVTVGAEGFGALFTIQRGLSVLALMVAGGVVGLRYAWSLASPGAAAAPLAVLLLTVSLVSEPGVEVSQQWRGTLLGVHIALALFGTASFALAAVTGILYLIQDHNLRQKKFGPMFSRLPSVGVLDQTNLRLILIGFPVYTLAIALGGLWAWDHNRTLQLQYLFAMVSWLIYAAILQARLTTGWRGRRAALLTLVGLVGLVGVLSSYLARSGAG